MLTVAVAAAGLKIPDLEVWAAASADEGGRPYKAANPQEYLLLSCSFHDDKALVCAQAPFSIS